MKIVGKLEIKPLKGVKPNGWNPNKMSPYMRESLKHGLETDGWIASQALLIWGTDENKRRKNLIIDGEHRWTVACELGFDDGPMVRLNGLTEVQAKALTIKMNQKRGEFDDDGLGVLIREIQGDMDVDDLGLELGMGDAELMKLLSEDPMDTGEEDDGKPNEPSGDTGKMPSNSSHVKLVQLFFDDKQHATFLKNVKLLAKTMGTKNVTETVLAATEQMVLNKNDAATDALGLG